VQLPPRPAFSMAEPQMHIEPCGAHARDSTQREEGLREVLAGVGCKLKVKHAVGSPPAVGIRGARGRTQYSLRQQPQPQSLTSQQPQMPVSQSFDIRFRERPSEVRYTGYLVSTFQ
jgi:hypothetical protein